MAQIDIEVDTKTKLNIGVKFTEEQIEWIMARAGKTGNSQAAIVRECVVKAMEQQPESVAN